MGNTEGQLYCIVRNPDNTHGNAKNVIRVGEWTHVAMVFDGSQEENKDKVKLFINGEEKGMEIQRNIGIEGPGSEGHRYLIRCF